MRSYVCPFGVYCPHGHNKKHQPSMVCWHFFTGKCTEDHKLYEQLEKLDNQHDQEQLELNIKHIEVSVDDRFEVWLSGWKK